MDNEEMRLSTPKEKQADPLHVVELLYVTLLFGRDT